MDELGERVEALVAAYANALSDHEGYLVEDRLRAEAIIAVIEATGWEVGVAALWVDYNAGNR